MDCYCDILNLSVITIEEIYYGLTAKPNARIQTGLKTFSSLTVKFSPSPQKLPSVRVN
jgi:hypothetical protein